MTGTRITLAEITAQEHAKQIADRKAQEEWEATAEGKAWREARDAHHKLMREADERFALEHPPEDEEEDEA